MKLNTFQDILRFAIEREIDAACSYAHLDSKAGSQGQKTMLRELEAEEKNHRKLLEDVLEGKAVPLPEAAVPDLKLSDYLLEEKIGAESTLQDLLIFAAKKEAKSVSLYTKLSSLSSLPEQKRLFDFLAGQEKVHKLRLEEQYEKNILQEN